MNTTAMHLDGGIRRDKQQVHQQTEKLTQNVNQLENLKDAAVVTKACAENAAYEVAEKKGQLVNQYSDFESLKANQQDLNMLGGFPFEKMSDGRVLAEGAKQSKPFGFTAGDGEGWYHGKQGKLTKTSEFHDSLFHSQNTEDYTGVQYKYTDKPQNVTPMIQKHIDTWKNKPEVIDPNINVPGGLKFQHIQTGMPPDVTQGQKVEYSVSNQHFVKEPVSCIEIDGMQIPLPSVGEIEKFIEDNFDVLKDMAKDAKFAKDQQKEAKRLLANIAKKKANWQKLKDKGQNEGADRVQKLINDLEGKVKAVHIKLEESESAMHTKSMQVESADSVVARKEMMQQTEIVADAKEQLDEAGMKLERKEAQRIKLQKKIGLQIAVGAVIGAGTEFIKCLGDEIVRCQKGEITKSEAALNVTKATAVGGAKGGAIAGVLAGTQWALQHIAVSSSRKIVSASANITSKALGPALLAAGLAYESYGILKSYNCGEITTAEMKQEFGRMTVTTVSSLGASIAAATLVGGPVGFAIGVGACIAISAIDHFLGKKIFECLFPEDEKETIIEKHYKELEKEVITEAYKIFDLEKNCSDHELKQAYKDALLKYHPDKNTEISEAGQVKNEKIFKAIFAAYTLLKECRERDFRAKLITAIPETFRVDF